MALFSTRQHLAAVVPVGEAIVLDLMRFADELRDAKDLDLPSGKQVSQPAKRSRLAQHLVEAMVEPWDPERYRDDYRVDVKALIDRRVAAGELTAGKKKAAANRCCQPAGAKVVRISWPCSRRAWTPAPAARGAHAANAPATTSKAAAKGGTQRAKASRAKPAAARTGKTALRQPGSSGGGRRGARKSA